jgi:hypothetical protein
MTARATCGWRWRGSRTGASTCMCRSPSSSGLGGSTRRVVWLSSGIGASRGRQVRGRTDARAKVVELLGRQPNRRIGTRAAPVDSAAPAASSAGTAGHPTLRLSSTERGAVSCRGGDGRGRASGQAAVTGRFTEVPAMTQQESSTVQPPTGEPLTVDERGELLRLRREVEELNTAARPPRRKNP